MKPPVIYSVISYAAVALALSGPVAAAPADMSGVPHPNHNSGQLAVNTGNSNISAHFALNRHPAAIPGYVVTAPATGPSLRAAKEPGEPTYDAEFLNDRELRQRAELNTLIELRSRH